MSTSTKAIVCQAPTRLSYSPIAVKVAEIQTGDRTDRRGKTRFVQGHPSPDGRRVLWRIQTRGARSPMVRVYEADETVIVFRKVA